MQYSISYIFPGIFFILSFYHFLIWIGRKEDKSNLAYSLFTLTHFLLVLNQRILNTMNIMPEKINHVLGTIIILCFSGTIALFAHTIFNLKKIKNISLGYFIFEGLLLLIFNLIYIFQDKFIFYVLFRISAIIYAFVFLILMLLQFFKNKEYKNQNKLTIALTYTIGLSCIIIGVILSIIFKNYYQDFIQQVLMFPFSIYLFMAISFAYALTNGFNKEHNELLELKFDLEQKVADRTAELEREKENKIRFFINAAHETKTPLTLIKNYLDEVIQKHNLGRDQDMRVVRDNILKLETDMLNFLDNEKIERGEMVYHHDQVIDFSQFTRDKIDLFRPVFEKKALHFQSQIRDRIYLKANSQSLDRVLNNLLDNAVKYSPPGGRVNVELKSSGRRMHLNVTNSGEVLCDTELKNIFNPYYQANHEKGNAQGMGLGLYIVKNIIQSLAGKIAVQSSVEEGTTVSIKLKKYGLKKSDVLSVYQLEQPRDVKAASLNDREQNHFHKNILLVEDDLDLLEILYRHLKEEYNVFCAVNGKDALELLENMVSIDLIISDIMMDVMDGYELLNRLPRFHLHVPFLFITAKITQDAKIAGLKQGAVDVIHKPFTIAELKYKIKNHLDKAAKIYARAKKSMTHRLDSLKIRVNRADELELLCKEYQLTPAEKKIVSLFGEGFDNKDLACKLDLSVRTIHNHTRNIFKKVGVRTRIELLYKMKFFY